MGSRAAAFFDLDRTLIADSSALAMVGAFSDAGLVSDFERPLAEIGRVFYRALGETWIGMQLTKRSIQRLAGWSVADVSEAARISVDKLSVYEEARALIDRHRSDGHLVVMATSTGREIVEPIAEALGMDGLISSEYEKHDGSFTGNLIGKWLWGPDKADAVREFAEASDIDLASSFAYSDSYYDRHLLEAVGHPRPVNPDPLLRAYAVRKGWPILSFGKGLMGALASLELYDLIRPIGHPSLAPINIQVSGIENIPTEGGCIVASNHRSYLDPVALGIVASRRGRKLRYLGKKEVFDAPVLGQFAKAMGQIRVERGSGDAKPLEAAIDAVRRGEAAAIFPQGTIPRGEEFFDPVLKGKTGMVRLALATGAPIVPVAMWDNEKIWPRSSRLPLVGELAKRTVVHARVGEPFHVEVPGGGQPDRETLHELTDQVMEAIASLLPDDVRYPPPPTTDEVLNAIPANVDPGEVQPGKRSPTTS